MPSLLRDGGLYYYMQQRLHSMYLVYPLFGMVRASNSRESKPSDKIVLKHICCCTFLQLSYSFFLSFPRFSKNLRKVDSSECCVRRKPMEKHRRVRSHDLPRCVKTNSVHVQRRFKDSPCFERNREDQRKCRACHKEKMCIRSGERRNVRRRTEKETSQICSRQIKHSNSSDNKSVDSLNKKNSTNVDLKVDKSEYRVLKDLEVKIGDVKNLKNVKYDFIE